VGVQDAGEGSQAADRLWVEFSAAALE